MYRLEFDLSGLPPLTNQQGSTHWRKIHKQRSEWKDLVAQAVMVHGRPNAPLLIARLTLTRFSSQAPDPDGLVSGFKAIVDGLVRSGVLVSDKFSSIGMPRYRWFKAPKNQGKVSILVEEVTEILEEKA